MRYYDNSSGTNRLKRRYLWAIWAAVIFFAIGFAIGALVIR